MEKTFYRNNRKRLMELLSAKSFAVVLSSGSTVNRSADEDYPFQVNNNFFYLTGVKQPDTHIILVKKDGLTEETLFIDRFDDWYDKWIGHRLTKEEASAISGVAKCNVCYKDYFEKKLDEVASTVDELYFDLETKDNAFFNSFGLEMAKKYSERNVKDIYGYVVSLRTVKQPCEIDCFKTAIDVTRLGVEALMQNAKPDMYEYQLEAFFDYVVKCNGNRELSFKTISASGKNATTLHYSSNDCIMKDGDLVLFDLGCKDNGYCADISRTFPVNGKFSPMQRKIYEIVLRANKTICKVAKAGMTIAELQKKTIDILSEGCLSAGLIKKKSEISKHYFHSISHTIGLDTHDPSSYKAPLPVGAVISNEPGLYFPELGTGVRIEDDLLLKSNGAVNLSKDIIKEIDDIENFMKKAKSE